MKKVIIGIGIVLAAIITLFFIAVPVCNDLNAKETAERLIEIPLPERTEYIESIYKAGKLVGNGNGMQYFGAILIKSEMTVEELGAYYSSAAQNDCQVYVRQQNGKAIRIIEHGELSFKTISDGDDYYIVYSFGKTNNSLFADLDLRGH